LSCRTSPPRGGRLSTRRLSPISNVLWSGGAPKLPISLHVGEMSGRTEGALSRQHSDLQSQRRSWHGAKKQNPPRRRVVGANQHHGQICSMAALTRSTSF
ncbi:MAG: hypothetical protein E5W19_24255, partial [Mesorhizobium sp.]